MDSEISHQMETSSVWVLYSIISEKKSDVILDNQYSSSEHKSKSAKQQQFTRTAVRSTVLSVTQRAF